MKKILIIGIIFIITTAIVAKQKATLFWWQPSSGKANFGDSLSPKIIERIIHHSPIQKKPSKQRFLALGSILHFARDNDVIWGSGLNGKIPLTAYKFSNLDVRAVRGPLTRQFLLSRGIPCPEVYGDPALLMPLLFPELTPHPTQEYIVIPNLNELKEFKGYPHLILPTEDCMQVVNKILHAKLVISGSLHGIIVAESFGIPARLIRITEKEHLLKYQDYYQGTGRPDFSMAHSLEEALKMGGERKPIINLNLLLESFPYDKV